MKFNYEAFFTQFKIYFGSIKSNVTVENIKKIVEANEIYGTGINQLAYILATAYHESGHDFLPRYEYGKAEYFVRKYWLNSKIAKILGNDDAKDAFNYRGRGLVQITGEDNYTKFGIADNPDKALEIDTAIDIMFRGMLNGMFSGRKLGTYVNDINYDFIKARCTVNGVDRAKMIAEYAEKMLIILKTALVTI